MNHPTVKSRVTSEWIREQVKANKTPVVYHRRNEYGTISKFYASSMEGTYNATVSSHEIVIDLQSQIKP